MQTLVEIVAHNFTVTDLPWLTAAILVCSLVMQDLEKNFEYMK